MRNKDIPLTHLQRQMLLGSLLGDACVWREKPTFNSYIRIVHSPKQREYVMWKYEMIKNIVRTPPREFIMRNGLGGTGPRFYFATRSLPCITELHEIIGKDRTITRRWLDAIDHPIALAAWLMDDGCCARNGRGYFIVFYTGDRTLEELECLQSWLGEWLNSNRIGIYIPKKFPTKTAIKIWHDKTIRTFEKLVRPYVIPSMDYKLPPENREDLPTRVIRSCVNYNRYRL
jgi:hypothetical protein